MLKTILICLDGSPQDETVTQAGLWIAKRLGSTLHGLHVLDLIALEGPLLYDISGSLSLIPQMNFVQETRKILKERGETILDLFKSRCEKESVVCSTYLEEGIVYKVIKDKSQTHDLTILGRRGLNYKLDSDLLGSTADRVVRKTTAPLLVLTHAFDEIKSPLLAYDGTQAAREAMISSVRFISELKLPLTVLNVNTDPEEGKRLLEEAKEYLAPHNLIVKYDLVKGSPRHEIPEYLIKHGHDFVVLGAHGHFEIVELLLGSTTEYVLWQAFAHVYIDR